MVLEDHLSKHPRALKSYWSSIQQPNSGVLLWETVPTGEADSHHTAILPSFEKSGAELLEEKIREYMWEHLRCRRNGSRHVCICHAYRRRTTYACCELTTTVLVAEVWEPPHVTQTDNLPSHREHKLHFAAPLASLFHLLLFYLFGSCHGPIGLSFLSRSSCHGSVGQRRKRAMGHRDLLWDMLVGRVGRSTVTTRDVFLVSPWGSPLPLGNGLFSISTKHFPQVMSVGQKGCAEGTEVGHWPGEMGPPASPLHLTHPWIHLSYTTVHFILHRSPALVYLHLPLCTLPRCSASPLFLETISFVSGNTARTSETAVQRKRQGAGARHGSRRSFSSLCALYSNCMLLEWFQRAG